ncbi:TPA: PGF-pre-PGF domain-containing protein [Candidatus Woesearchaeota archaeon]|nr:PGF-pre-PGF domain-containing protein [Candidatus Woesearchaeota archaeon]HIH31574.1 PGF-pre-PGF domain-containing protein [Candidatus Woesearchaeota archaeon]HIH54269.1 PGF-pre-PGF domain-containing protein [Candidatus Woesearchaeota archaeon]HIJ02542.1 PGF-pre-PGF domain-containing protein [Candidatus Woesearchaeota archaeon]HIJ13412.1 PGF-pre-PGF domain-containing protein [Candidatus Woesearchaeota archaeon]
MTKKNNSRVISVILTFFVIGILIFSGPTKAVEITLSTPMVDGEALTGDATIGDVISFNATIDYSAGENIPIQNISILVNGSVECVFDIDGTNLSGGSLCDGFTVTLNDSNYVYANASRYGYGFGVDVNGTTTTVNTSFGQGFGYGYSSNPILHYVIEWDTQDFDADDYNIVFYANANNGATYFRYASETALDITLDEASSSSSSGSSDNDDDEIPPAVAETKIFIYPDLTKGLKSIDITSDRLPVYGLILDVVSSLKNAQVKFTEVTTPKEPFTGTVFKYFQIDVTNMQLSGAKIKFKIEKSWLSDKLNHNVFLARYANNKWEKLDTKKLSEDSTYVYYEATTSGFSQFAVVAEAQPAPVTGAATTPVEEPKIGVEEKTAAVGVSDEKVVQSTIPQKDNRIWAWVTVIIIVAVAMFIYYVSQKRRNMY